MKTVRVSEAQQILDVGHAQIYALVKAGILISAGRGVLTAASVDSRKLHQDYRAAVAKGDTPSRKEQRMIVQTLLLAGVFDPRDIARAEVERLRNAVRQHSEGSSA